MKSLFYYNSKVVDCALYDRGHEPFRHNYVSVSIANVKGYHCYYVAFNKYYLSVTFWV